MIWTAKPNLNITWTRQNGKDITVQCNVFGFPKSKIVWEISESTNTHFREVNSCKLLRQIIHENRHGNSLQP